MKTSCGPHSCFEFYHETKNIFYPLRNHTVEEMIPIVGSMLQGQGTVTGMRDQLIIRTTLRNLAEIKKVLAQLDRPLRNFRIIVRQGLEEDLESTDASISGDIKIGKEGGVNIGREDKDRGGLEIGNGRVRARINRRKFSSDDSTVQQMMTLEGRAAFIQIGQTLPFTEERTVQFGNTVTSEKSVVLKEVRTGFNVTPRVQGDSVTLKVVPVRSEVRDGQINIQRMATTVTGRLGEWIELGGVGQDRISGNTEIGRSSASDLNKKWSIFLKVEEVW